MLGGRQLATDRNIAPTICAGARSGLGQGQTLQPGTWFFRKLRWWCVAGEGCTDHAEHKSLSYNGPGGSLGRLPSLAALEQDGAGGSEPSMGPSSS